ncbi:EAL domain-containing protein [Rugamonas sp. CCM 8940]|uniref:bifunctional diguanylate cyclase/phosphodiesterase n=1 Tax=Rugamonas sp. CCM 8940 TaxID=2765359 RepID=UPI0018F3C847|nr:EAL domain-containing protein [Rugamonas sp. CCM 8940]MBJ7312721.1 EAL domain-containing protein [Rugamonas sp. CCM 8940]
MADPTPPPAFPPGLAAAPAAAPPARSRAVLLAPVALALLCGLGATAALFYGVRQLEQDKLALAFEQRAHARLQALREGVSNAIAGLRAVNQLFASTPQVTRQQFRLFVQPILDRSPYTYGISYTRFLPQAQRPAFEAELAGRLPGRAMTEMRDGRAVPAGQRSSYWVIDYIEPLAGNEAAFGLDTAYPQAGNVARERAYDTGLPLAGALIALAQGPAPRTGVIVSMPVYRYGAVLADVAARRSALEGETNIVIRPNDLVRKIYAAAGLLGAAGVNQRVYAADREEPAGLVFEELAEAEPAPAALLRWLYPAAPARAVRRLDLAGQPWLLLSWSSPGWAAADHLASLATLALGLVLSLLAAALVQALVWRNRHIQRRVELRTAQLKQLNQALRLRERAIESSTNAVVITAAAPHNPIVYVNPAFERITGYRAAEVLGKSPRLLHGHDLEQQGAAEIRAAIREQRDGHAVVRNYRKDGAMFWNDIYISPVREADGAIHHYVSIQHDITAVKAYESELHHQATHDALSGLPNRALMKDRLRQSLHLAARKDETLWVVSLDLDHFKFVNGRLGHKGGDRLLQAVAERLLAGVRPVDTVARIGGDEFVLLLLPEQGASCPRGDEVQRLLALLAEPLVVDGQELFLTCSAGVAVYPGDGAEAEQLVERADIAMHRAKELGRDNYQFFTAAMNEQLGERLRIEGALRSALERREFVLHYQPQIDVVGGRIFGMEALIRWQHPELGMVAPSRFIGLAEETGLILPIGAWVLRSACLQLLEWQRGGRPGLRIAVNVSARQLAAPGFVQMVAELLAETGLAPRCLELELTESFLMQDVEHAIGMMRQLKRLGVLLAIDDFGTGYSSLAHLKRFEVDVLKIDQTFVRDLAVDPDDAAIVATIISLAANLKLEVISEGVETQDQVDFLRRHGCRQMQGYHFGRPVDAAAFEQLLLADEARAGRAEQGADSGG